MNQTLQLYTWWIYIGLGHGKGLPHKIILLEDGEVVTWSEPHIGEAEGYSWCGPVDEFRKAFRRRY